MQKNESCLKGLKNSNLVLVIPILAGDFFESSTSQSAYKAYGQSIQVPEGRYFLLDK